MGLKAVLLGYVVVRGPTNPNTWIFLCRTCQIDATWLSVNGNLRGEGEWRHPVKFCDALESSLPRSCDEEEGSGARQ